MSGTARQAATVVALVLAASACAAATVTVTPSGDTVPANLLRIELHLARPLARPLAMDHVRLLDRDGAPIPDAFLDLPLPAADGRTIALLLHPARVKTGVGANRALGRALRAGEEATLVVDDPQLPQPLRRRWHVTAAVDQALQPATWRVDVPRAGSRSSLLLVLEATLDASSARSIALRDPQGERVAGVASLHAGETLWRFEPDRPWRAGRYEIVVHPLLEDVAGNRPCTPFEATGLGAMACDVEAPTFDVR